MSSGESGGSAEDRRQAASIAVSIAASVSAAAVAVIGALVLLTTYIIDKHGQLGLFYTLVALSALMLVWSAILGAKGIADIAHRGFKGEWDTRTDGLLFDRQALLSLAGILLLVGAAIVGLNAPRQSDGSELAAEAIDRQVDATDRALLRLDRRVARLEALVDASKKLHSK